MVSKCTKASEVGRHGMVGEIPAYHVGRPSTLFRDRFVRAPSQARCRGMFR